MVAKLPYQQTNKQIFSFTWPNQRQDLLEVKSDNSFLEEFVYFGWPVAGKPSESCLKDVKHFKVAQYRPCSTSVKRKRVL